MNFLVIEDEPLIQRTISALLKRKGVKVDATESGRAAIELIKNNKYDQIICDLMLQDITGFDIIEESKLVLNEKEISTIFCIITAYSSQQIIDKAKSYNCEIVQKPFDDINDFIEKVIIRSKSVEH